MATLISQNAVSKDKSEKIKRKALDEPLPLEVVEELENSEDLDVVKKPKKKKKKRKDNKQDETEQELEMKKLGNVLFGSLYPVMFGKDSEGIEEENDDSVLFFTDRSANSTLSVYEDDAIMGEIVGTSSTTVMLPTVDVHSVVAYLLKSEVVSDFYQMIDFLKASHLKFALSVNPIIYLKRLNDFWTSAKKEMMDGVPTIIGKVEGKSIRMTEASIRSHLLLQDGEGIECLPNSEIFENLRLLGYEGT